MKKINRLDSLSSLRTDVVNAGYDPDKCFFYTESELELVEEKEMGPFELLLNHWGIEVGEKFIIKKGNHDYYYFDSEGALKNSVGNYSGIDPWDLVTGRRTIGKFKPAKEMTVSELEEALKLPKGTLRVKRDD